jgi:DNA repair protein RecO (recombination protein O)
MAIVRDEAIVLSRSRFGETSLIVSLFTLGRGPVRCLAKGARKPKNRFGSCLEPTNHVHAVYYRKEGRDLHLLSGADLLTPYPGIRVSLLRLAYGYAILGTLIGLKREETPAENLFRLALDALREIEVEGEELLEPALWGFLLSALADAGYRPEFERCVVCGSAADGARVRFDPRGGGLLCAKHASGGIALSEETVRTLRELSSGRGPRHSVSPRAAAEGREALRRFLEEHDLGKAPFRSLGLLKPGA